MSDFCLVELTRGEKGVAMARMEIRVLSFDRNCAHTR
jgi:hypothetical protein